MARFIVCDGGCGKQSPDAEGFHAANAWTKVWYRNSVRDPEPRKDWPDLVFCSDCWLRVTKGFRQP